MSVLHFIFLCYAIVTLEGLRPRVSPAAYQKVSRHECTLDAALKLPSGAVTTPAVVDADHDDAPVFFIDLTSIVALSFSWLERLQLQTTALSIKPAKGSYYYAFSGLSPPTLT